MVRMLSRRGCSPLFFVRHLRFRVFAIWLGIVSLTSLALVFRKSMSLNSAFKLRSPFLSEEIKDGLVKDNVRNSSKGVEDLDVMKTDVANSSAACRLPVLDPFHSSVIHFTKDLGKLRCSGVSYSSFESNVLRVEGEGVISAQYRKIDRTPGKDFGVVLSDPVAVQNTGERTGTLLINYEALALLCCEIFSGVRLARLPLLRCAMLQCGRKLKIEDRN